MAPRFQTLRPAQTASAREAMRSFFCDLCQKGYSRMNEYEAHLSSYDHSHKQRLKDMKAMVRDPAAAARARRQEAKATDAVISIKLGVESGGSSTNPGGSMNSTGSGSVPGSMSGTAAASSGVAPGFKKGGFRKGGFKSAFVSVDDAADAATATPAAGSTAAPGGTSTTPGLSALLVTPISLPAGSAAGTAAAAVPSSLPAPLSLAGAGSTTIAYDESDTDNEGYDVYDPRKPTD